MVAASGQGRKEAPLFAEAERSAKRGSPARVEDYVFTT